MGNELTTSERDIYMQTAAVTELCHDLFRQGKLNVETEDDAIALGHEFFAERCRAGIISEDWEESAHYELAGEA